MFVLDNLLVHLPARCHHYSRTWWDSPMLERVVERSMMARLPGLLSTERLASDRSAVTRVMEILKKTR